MNDRRIVACRRALLVAALLGLFFASGTRAEVREVEVPLRLDAAFLRRLLVEQMFTGEGETMEAWADTSRCNFLVLSEPRVETRSGEIRILAAARARVGTPIGALCWFSYRWEGFVEILEEPRLDPHAPVVRFRVADTHLYGKDQRKRIFTGTVWSWVKGWVHPRLAAFEVDLKSPLEELGQLLPLFLATEDAARVETIVTSLRLSQTRATPDGLLVTLAFRAAEAAAEPPAAQPEPTLSPAELQRWETVLQQWDAFLTFVIFHTGGDTTIERLRFELLGVLLDSRYEIARALISPDGGPDPVPQLFVTAWSRLAPHLRALSADLPGEDAVRYLSFIAAGDALAALEEIGPEVGLDISAAGLRRLARMIAPAEIEDPLEYDTEVDPELRLLFGFGPPLELPQAATESALSWLWPNAWAAGPIDEVVRRLNGWVPHHDEIDAYLPMVGEVLEFTVDRVLEAKDLGSDYHDLYRWLILATAWQESCWRQFIRVGKAVRPIRSPVGSVGLMQVNERVWRSFYDARALENDIRYNAQAGSEIALHYLRDYAIRKREHTAPGGKDNLARATYSAYNAGPGQLRRYRDPKTGPRARRVDEAFWKKYQRVKGGDVLAVAECFGK